jgi:hypothetical protein
MVGNGSRQENFLVVIFSGVTVVGLLNNDLSLINLLIGFKSDRYL